LVRFTVFCYILWTFGKDLCNLVYIFFLFGILYQEKSGNPGRQAVAQNESFFRYESGGSKNLPDHDDQGRGELSGCQGYQIILGNTYQNAEKYTN
jgi:hypothetical protein